MPGDPGAEDPRLLGQPWEMMRDDRGPLAFRGVTIRRQLKGARVLRTSALELPLRVLLIVSRPSDIGFIDPRNSIPPILDALDTLPAGMAEVNFCDPPTLKQLEKTISGARKAKRPFHIVHFDGHGTYLPKTGVGALAFERENAKTHLVSGIDLGDLLTRLDIPLALLEACRGSDLSDRPVFGSVAPALLKAGVGSVVAFSHSVHVKAARILVERFYAELAAGMTVGRALDESRAGLHADRSRWLRPGPDAETIDLQDWFIPQLYQVGPDPALITGGQAEPAPARARRARQIRKRMHGEFPPRPMYEFHGRALELLKLERFFRFHPAVVLSGMGGMGKTALAREAAAWWIRTGRFDSAIFVSFEQKARAERVVQVLGNALEEGFSARTAEDQWDAAVDLFHERSVLLIWDNFESTLPIYQDRHDPAMDPEPGKPGEAASPLAFSPDARSRLTALFRDLTDGAPQGRLLVTCRPERTGLPGIREFPLQGLAHWDGLHLLAATLDLKGISTERPGYAREEIDSLLHDLDHHPLSIELISPHLKSLTPKEIREKFTHHLSRFTNETAYESRNRSLLASLAFSASRLSPMTREILPWLAWFRGGVFEYNLLAFTELPTEKWEPIKTELTATALVNTEELEIFNTPFLRFHPTLPYAVRPSDAPDREAAVKRFIAVYQKVTGTAKNLLMGDHPIRGMVLMTREEANLRQAIRLTFSNGDDHKCVNMADIFQIYLERAGRLQECDELAVWVNEKQPRGYLTEAACTAIRNYAWTYLTQGRGGQAIQMVRGLLHRLETEEMRDKLELRFQLAVSHLFMGRIYNHTSRSDLALPHLQTAIKGFEQFGGEQQSNLAATLGSLSNAYLSLGQFTQAMEASAKAIAISRELGQKREVASGLIRIAQILMEQQRYAEANEMLEKALMTAYTVGDRELQGLALRNQGVMQEKMGNYKQAIGIFKQAFSFFQQSASFRTSENCRAVALAKAGPSFPPPPTDHRPFTGPSTDYRSPINGKGSWFVALRLMGNEE